MVEGCLTAAPSPLRQSCGLPPPHLHCVKTERDKKWYLARAQTREVTCEGHRHRAPVVALSLGEFEISNSVDLDKNFRSQEIEQPQIIVGKMTYLRMARIVRLGIMNDAKLVSVSLPRFKDGLDLCCSKNGFATDVLRKLRLPISNCRDTFGRDLVWAKMLDPSNRKAALVIRPQFHGLGR
jgi:hypothetical protein